LCLQVPINATFSGTIVGFDVRFNAESVASGNDTLTTCDIILTRNSFSKGVSIFITMLCWAISVGILSEACDYVFVRSSILKEDDTTRAGLCATILFALPALRAVQPGIPPLEVFANIDIWSFHINMMMVALALILHIGHATWDKSSDK
jgi:hypothetical protein